MRAICSQVSLQQEEEEVEEFQLIEKLQQLGINQGEFLNTWECYDSGYISLPRVCTTVSVSV